MLVGVDFFHQNNALRVTRAAGNVLVHFHHGDVVSTFSEVQGAFAARVARAHDNDLLAHGVAVHEGLRGQHDVLAVDARNFRQGGHGTRAGDDHVGVGGFDEFGGGFRVQEHLDAELTHAMDEPVLEFHERILEGHVVGKIDLTAEVIALFIEAHFVTAFSRSNGGLHAGGAAADHGHDLLFGGRRNDVGFNAYAGVHGAGIALHHVSGEAGDAAAEHAGVFSSRQLKHLMQGRISSRLPRRALLAHSGSAMTVRAMATASQ